MPAHDADAVRAPLSAAGEHRRAAMLDELGVVQADAVRRRRRRRAGGLAAVGLALSVGLVGRAVFGPESAPPAAPDPGSGSRSGPVAVAPPHVPPTGTPSPAPSASVSDEIRIVRVTSRRPRSIARRSGERSIRVIRHERPATIARAGDAELLAVLAAIDASVGLVRTGEEAWLTVDVARRSRERDGDRPPTRGPRGG